MVGRGGRLVLPLHIIARTLLYSDWGEKPMQDSEQRPDIVWLQL